VETLLKASARDLSPTENRAWLLCRQGGSRIALPAAQVLETMRPLPTDAVPEMPPFVLGLAVVRGSAVPVVDAGTLLGRVGDTVGRWVTVSLGERRVALAVESVEGVQRLPSGTLERLPPLLRGASERVVAAVQALDGQLLVVLEAGRLFTEDAWLALVAQKNES
jgi:purine-binding chemotaxis protein CheW